MEHIDRSGSYLISSISFGYPNFSVNYTRGGDPGQKNIYIDQIAINGSSGGFPDRSRLELLDTLNRFLGSRGASTTDDAEAVQDYSSLETAYRSTVLKLETKFAQQIDTITSWTVDQAQAYEDRKLQLASETQLEREKLHAEYEKKSSELKDDLDGLEERRRALDDRDYMQLVVQLGAICNEPFMIDNRSSRLPTTRASFACPFIS